MQHLQFTQHLTLQFPSLDIDTLQIIASCDASFRNRLDHSSQLGYAIILTDESRRCCFIKFKSYKSKRVTRSSTAGKTLAFADAFDAGYVLKHNLSRLLDRDIPLLMLTDSDGRFRVLTKSRYAVERRLMVDIAAVRESHGRGDISNIVLIESKFNIAEGLTKAGPNHALWKALTIGKIDRPISEWVIEKDARRVQQTLQK